MTGAATKRSLVAIAIATNAAIPIEPSAALKTSGACHGRHANGRGADCRARACEIPPLVLAPELGDFNDDLRLDPSRLTASLRAQLARKDATVFLPS